MIPLDPRQHRAEVRPDGSIVLPGIDAVPESATSAQSLPVEDIFVSVPQAESSMLWEITTEEEPKDVGELYSQQEMTEVTSAKPSSERTLNIDPTEAIALLKSGQLAAYRAAMSLLQESANQYRVSAKDIRGTLERSRAGLADTGSALWAFLTQPVWIVRKNAEPRKYSRGTLFVLDTVRFGGTFAALFTAIFLTLNYQSFWEIVRSNIRPIHSVQNEQMLVSTVDEALRNKLMKSPALAVAGRSAGDLLSFLPEVGPPDNRIIIPKLNLNVPLVTPSYQNLLQENWAGVEEDIQASLQHGVVHYPGTARPGQAGNFFVTGHSSYYPWAPGKYKNVFARLHEVDVGDEYWVYYGGDRHRYRVVEKKEVKPSDVTVLDQPLSHRTATLMTCTPVGTTLRRLIITSQEIDPVTGVALDVGEHGERQQQKLNVEQLPI